MGQTGLGRPEGEAEDLRNLLQRHLLKDRGARGPPGSRELSGVPQRGASAAASGFGEPLDRPPSDPPHESR